MSSLRGAFFVLGFFASRKIAAGCRRCALLCASHLVADRPPCDREPFTGHEYFIWSWNVRQKRISAVLKTPWATDGKDFSARLWNNREQLIGTLQSELTRALITGADSASVAKTIAQKMNAAQYAASRLVQTEITRVITESDKDTFAEMGIDEVEIVGTLDLHTCDTCGGMDGKHMPRSEAKAGTTAPPFHPNCRCVIVPYDEEFRDEYRIMRDPVTGKSKMIENMTFKEWKEKYGSMEREESAKRKYEHEDTVISPDIKTNAYRRKFNNLGENKKIERVIYNRACEILNHRSGTNYEDLVFIDTLTGDTIQRTDYEREKEVKPSIRMEQWYKAREPHTVIGIHNHPHSGFPSIEDINVAII